MESRTSHRRSSSSLLKTMLVRGIIILYRRSLRVHSRYYHSIGSKKLADPNSLTLCSRKRMRLLPVRKTTPLYRIQANGDLKPRKSPHSSTLSPKTLTRPSSQYSSLNRRSILQNTSDFQRPSFQISSEELATFTVTGKSTARMPPSMKKKTKASGKKQQRHGRALSQKPKVHRSFLRASHPDHSFRVDSGGMKVSTSCQSLSGMLT